MSRLGSYFLIFLILINACAAQYGYQPPVNQQQLRQYPYVNSMQNQNQNQQQQQQQQQSPNFANSNYQQQRQVGFQPQTQQRFPQNNMANGQSGFVQPNNQQPNQPQYANQNNQLTSNQYRNSGGQPGLLSNPVRDNQNRLAVNSSTGSQTNFYLKIESYQNGRWVLGDGTYCNPASSCSFAFTSVIASLDGSVVYNSTNFFSVSASTGQLATGDWTDAQLYGLHTKPVSVDIFVHSLTFNNGYTNGSKYIFNAPVSHVDTFVLNLIRVDPVPATGTTTPLSTSLTGQKMGTGLTISYYVQCNTGYMGDYCDLQCSNYSTNSAICTSTVTGDRKLCVYNSAKTSVNNCTYCDYRSDTNSCANIFVTSTSTGVAHAYKIWTIVLACLLALAVLIILLLVCIKVLGDQRNRRAQQFPEQRQPSAYSGGYRPNATNSVTPLLGGSEKDWERERQPVIIRRPPPSAIPEETSTQENDSFQDTRPPYTSQQRREAQV